MKTFKNWDIYYLYEYACSFMIHGDGEPLLLRYEDERTRFCYVVMKRDIADCRAFQGTIISGIYYDFETPYGYGGPLCDVPVNEESQKRFLEEIIEYCKSNSVISQFVRFHPLLDNYKAIPIAIQTRYLRDTIFMDTSSPDIIMKNMDSKNRNMVRKAIKKGVSIIRKPIEDYGDFMPMYTETMLRNGAEDYYTFREDYFSSLGDLKENACIFYAMLEKTPISAAIIFYNDCYMHYHLSGSNGEFRQYSPSNLLLYEAACWGSSKGIQYFHLGGGMQPDDSLFGFKKQFNKFGKVPFAVGRTIFDIEKYNELIAIRKNINPDFCEDNNYMIQYRG